jgi:transposase
MTRLDLKKASHDELIDTVLSLHHELEWYKRQMFGRKSERFVPDDTQTALDLGVAPAPEHEQSSRKVEYERTEKKQTQGHCRGDMPSHLPVVDVVIEPSEDVSGCERMGEEISWQYEMKRGSLYIKRFIRPKYVRPDHDGVAVGALPALPIEKGNFGPGFMAGVAVDKHVYHMPLDRQRRKFAAEYGVDIPESTLCDIVRRTAFWLEGVYRINKDRLLRSTYLMADETPVPVLVKDKSGKTHRGYFWVYYAPLERIVTFDYRKSRSALGPCEFLKPFTGILQTDGYAGYNEVVSRPGMIHAACMAHVRRKFEEAFDTDRERARHALDVIRPWFVRETEAKNQGRSLEERFSGRLESTVAEMVAFEGWLKTTVTAVLPQSPLGKAVAYALNMWPRFNAFMTDPRVEISSNLVENAIRPVALGRKNFLFLGSHDAAQRAAILYSIFATAKLHGIDPFVYTRHLLIRLPAESAANLEKYLPQNWAANFKDTAGQE